MSHETKDSLSGMLHPEFSGDSFFLGHDLSLMRAAHAKIFAQRHLREDSLCQEARDIAVAEPAALREDPSLDEFLAHHNLSYEIVVDHMEGGKFEPSAIFVVHHEGKDSNSPLLLVDFETDKRVTQLPEILVSNPQADLSAIRRN